MSGSCSHKQIIQSGNQQREDSQSLRIINKALEFHQRSIKEFYKCVLILTKLPRLRSYGEQYALPLLIVTSQLLCATWAKSILIYVQKRC